MVQMNIHTTENNSRVTAISTALGIIAENCATTSADFVDSETGEILFSYHKGNVDYIQGDFAVEMIKHCCNLQSSLDDRLQF